MSTSIFSFFGLRENPFKINSDPRFLFVTQHSQAAFDELSSGIQARKGLLLLTGEVGTGKTMILRRLLDWLNTQKMPTALIFNARLNTDDLLDLILHDFSIPCDSPAKSQKLLALNNWLLERYRAGLTPVLVIDEAQGLPAQSLEELRLLLDLQTFGDALLQILLAGQPELDDKLKQSDLRHLRQRVAVHCRTAPLTLAQTQGYIRERLRVAGAPQEIFAPDSIAFIHAYARGIPRIINVLCEHALINGCAEGLPLVTPRQVEQAARDCQLERVDSISRILASAPAGGSSLDDADSILFSVSRSTEIAPPPIPQSRLERQSAAHVPNAPSQVLPRSADSRENSRYAVMAASVGASDVFQQLTPSSAAPPRSPQVRTLDHATSSTPRPAKNPRAISPRATPPRGPLPLSALRLIAKSFVADARLTGRQTRNFLRTVLNRHGKPLLQQARRALTRLQNSFNRWYANATWPHLQQTWQSCRNRLSSAARAIRTALSSSAVDQPKRPRTLDSLRRWLRQPLRPAGHAPARNERRAAHRQQG